MPHVRMATHQLFLDITMRMKMKIIPALNADREGADPVYSRGQLAI